MNRAESIERAASELSKWWNGRERGDMDLLLGAIDEALALPKDNGEPVAWLFQHEDTGLTDCIDNQQVEWGYEKNNPRWQKITPLYTHPPQADGCDVCGEVYQVVGALWNGEANIVPVLDNLSASASGKPVPHKSLLPFVPKADAEPVLWVSPDDLANEYMVGINAVKPTHQDKGKHYTLPLYTHPPQADAEPAVKDSLTTELDQAKRVCDREPGLSAGQAGIHVGTTEGVGEMKYVPMTHDELFDIFNNAESEFKDGNEAVQQAVIDRIAEQGLVTVPREPTGAMCKMRNAHKAILCWVGSLSVLWGAAWAFSFVSYKDWQSFPIIVTTVSVFVCLVFAGIHFFEKKEST